MAAPVMHPSLAVVATPHGRGLRATAPVRAGERLLYAPAAAQLDGVDADELATTLLAELERGTHKWLSSLPRGVAYSAAGCDDATRAALCATAGGGLGDCAFVRSVGQAQGRADQRWARSFVVANALRVKSGHLRLAPLFMLLNHAEDGLRPTELEDGALSLEAVRDLRPGDDVRIDYGHGSHGGAGVLHRYGWFPSTASTEFVVFDEASDDAVLESLRKRLALDNGVTLRSTFPVPTRRWSLRLYSRSSVPTVLFRYQGGSTAAKTETTCRRHKPRRRSRRRRPAACSGCSQRRRTATSLMGGSCAGRRNSWRAPAPTAVPCSTLPSRRRERTPSRRSPTAARRSRR